MEFQTPQRPQQGRAVRFDHAENPNPSIPLPLEDIILEVTRGGQGSIVGQARITDAFIAYLIQTRRDPHLSQLHLAAITDTLAIVTFEEETGSTHGRQKRVVQKLCEMEFRAEAYVVGSGVEVPQGAREFDWLEVVWHCIPRNERASVFSSGTCCVTVLGCRQGGSVELAQSRVTYVKCAAAAPTPEPVLQLG